MKKERLVKYFTPAIFGGWMFHHLVCHTVQSPFAGDMKGRGWAPWSTLPRCCQSIETISNILSIAGRSDQTILFYYCTVHTSNFDFNSKSDSICLHDESLAHLGLRMPSMQEDDLSLTKPTIPPAILLQSGFFRFFLVSCNSVRGIYLCTRYQESEQRGSDGHIPGPPSQQRRDKVRAVQTRLLNRSDAYIRSLYRSDQITCTDQINEHIILYHCTDQITAQIRSDQITERIR